MSRKKSNIVLENQLVEKYAAEGKSIIRYDGKVVFVQHVIPGDKVKVVLKKNKKDYAEGVLLEIQEPSKLRQAHFCEHFGACGGCQWQMLDYAKQLEFKHSQVKDQMTGIGKLTDVPMQDIVPSLQTTGYRNKMEFTFSNKKYLSSEDLNNENVSNLQNVLGLHARGLFDKIVEIKHCHIEGNQGNEIRNYVRELCEQNNFDYYDIKMRTGFLRNIIIRECTTGEIMVNLVVSPGYDDQLNFILERMKSERSEITSLYCTINPKLNDSILDLEPKLYSGNEYIIEQLGDYKFIISPKSFFQTNSKQAERLYAKGLEMAELQGGEVLYDLYCGTGSIGIFMSQGVKKVIGVELVDDAIADAKVNAKLNGVEDKTEFFVGDAVKLCDTAFFEAHGQPDIVVLDPPRMGLMPELIETLKEIKAPKILYISCNPATQARDLKYLAECYDIVSMCPVDMFPHTHHIENIAMLKLKS